MMIQVECYAGYRGEETPLRFYCGRRKIEVLEVVDRWLAPDHRYFKVKGDEGGLYIIRYECPVGRMGDHDVFGAIVTRSARMRQPTARGCSQNRARRTRP